MSEAPTFSIVIPTRNRVELLRGALATAMTQSCGDVEILVSDNASTDATPRAAEMAAERDPRVRYVRTDRPLPQPESWEFAYEQSRGTWVTQLSDDDAIVPSLLGRMLPFLEAGPEVIAFRRASYVHPGLDPPWPNSDEVNVLTCRPMTGSVREVGARDELARWFARRERGPLPGVSNAFVHRRALERLRREAGRWFEYPDPAAVAAAGLLALLPSYLAVDLPLNIEGISRTNVGAGYRHRLSGTHQLTREYHADELFELVPLRSRTMANAGAESLLRTRRALPDACAGLTLDPVAYFVSCHQELTDPRHDVDRTDDIAEWRRALDAQPRAVRADVRRELRRRRTDRLARGAFRAASRSVPALRRLRAASRRLRGRSDFLLFDGRSCGFSDLPAAAAYLDRVVLPTVESGRGCEVVSA